MLIFCEDANKAQVRYVAAQLAGDNTLERIVERLKREVPDLGSRISVVAAIKAIAKTALDFYGVYVFIDGANGTLRLCAQPATEREHTHSLPMAGYTGWEHLSWVFERMAELVEAAINQTTAPTPTGDNRKVSR